MTENAFMTHDIWFEAREENIKGYRQTPVIRNKTQWDILEFLDVLGSHEFDPRALEHK